MQIDRHVETATSEAPGRHDVVAESREAPAPRDDDHFVDVRVSFDDGRRIRLDEIRQVCVRVVPPERAQEWRGEHHIAERAQPDEQDPHLVRIDRRFVNQHHWMSSLMG